MWGVYDYFRDGPGRGLWVECGLGQVWTAEQWERGGVVSPQSLLGGGVFVGWHWINELVGSSLGMAGGTQIVFGIPNTQFVPSVLIEVGLAL